jgi:hypothetical protein
MNEVSHMDHHHQDGHAGVHMPLPTAWPIVLALGVTLIIAGMVTHVLISLLGLVLSVIAAIGWFRNVLPEEAAEIVEAPAEEFELASARTSIERLPVGTGERKIVPVESFRFTTGLLGGLAGGVAMIVPATLFSLLKYHSLWYAMNLLAAGGFVDWATQSNDFLAQFHMQGFLAALAIHALTSLLVGSLYGALLPMFPRWPILTAGFLAPLLWTGLLASALNIISPILNERIDWPWFVASQIAFGLVAGFVVNLQAKVRTPQFQALPFAVRAGFHANLDHDADGKDGQA